MSSQVAFRFIHKSLPGVCWILSGLFPTRVPGAGRKQTVFALEGKDTNRNKRFDLATRSGATGTLFQGPAILPWMSSDLSKLLDEDMDSLFIG